MCLYYKPFLRLASLIAAFQEVSTEGIAIEDGFTVNEDKDYLMTLSAASGGGFKRGTCVTLFCVAVAVSMFVDYFG